MSLYAAYAFIAGMLIQRQVDSLALDKRSVYRWYRMKVYKGLKRP